MGYQSDVALAVSSKALPVLMHILSKTPGGRDFCFQDHDHLIKDYGGQEGAILFYWSGIKWYTSDPVITAVNDFLKRMEDLTNEDCEEWEEEWRFVHLGEDQDDMEVRGYGFSDVSISREINF